MTDDEFDSIRDAAFAAVDRARFVSILPSLPSGECDNASIVEFLHRRREEIVEVARTALGDYASSISSEMVLRLIYGKVCKNDIFAIPA